MSDEALDRFLAALRDELNAPRALAVVWETLRDERIPPGDRRAALLAMDAVLPMGLAGVASVEHRRGEDVPLNVLVLVERREAARANEDFATADALRIQVAALGYDVRDSATGSIVARRTD
jgi:cysteinyl-tRNA synthetase